MEDPEDPKKTFWETVKETVRLINELVPICEALNEKDPILPIDEDNFIRLNASLQFVGFVFPEQLPNINAIRKEVIFVNKNCDFLAKYDILEPKE
jgi:hypothetical protein